MALQVVKPRIRGFICTNAHSVGCRQNVQNQVNHIKETATTKQNGLNVLVVGASTGYGLASRIALTWAYAAKSIGIFYERPGIRKTDCHSPATITPPPSINSQHKTGFSLTVSTATPFPMRSSERLSIGSKGAWGWSIWWFTASQRHGGSTHAPVQSIIPC